MTQLQRRRIPDAAVTRLPVYLQILNNLHATNVLRFSSDELAALAGVNAAKVRKDLLTWAVMALAVSDTKLHI